MKSLEKRFKEIIKNFLDEYETIIWESGDERTVYELQPIDVKELTEELLKAVEDYENERVSLLMSTLHLLETALKNDNFGNARDSLKFIQICHSELLSNLRE